MGIEGIAWKEGGMRIVWTYVISLVLVAETFAFVGKDSTEASLQFSYFLEVESDSAPRWSETKELIDEQLLFLFGPLSFAEVYAVPRGEHKIWKEGIEEVSSGTFRVHYRYEGILQVKKGPLKNYSVILPRSIEEDRIYDPGVDPKSGINRCTDDHYNSFEDFWYFWNPYQEGCALEEGEEYDVIPARIERIPNTKKTYPEYARLVDKDNQIQMYAFVGMDEVSENKNPLESDDLNAVSYRALREGLLERGFSDGPFPNKEVDRILKGQDFRRPFLERFEKQSGDMTLQVNLFFGPTGIDEKSGAFHYFYKEATEKASVMIYDGHSGLGGHLDLAAIEALHGFKIKQSQKRYQIFFFNSCSSYTYFNTVYFYRKSRNNIRYRTESLDILTNGLATEFEEDAGRDLMLIDAILLWTEGERPPSYQELAKQMDQENLFAVSGDEDNPEGWE